MRGDAVKSEATAAEATQKLSNLREADGAHVSEAETAVMQGRRREGTRASDSSGARRHATTRRRFSNSCSRCWRGWSLEDEVARVKVQVEDNKSGVEEASAAQEQINYKRQ